MNSIFLSGITHSYPLYGQDLYGQDTVLSLLSLPRKALEIKEDVTDFFKIQTPKQPQYEPKPLDINFDISKDAAAGFLLLVGIACLVGGVIAIRSGLPPKLEAKIGVGGLFFMGGLFVTIGIDELFLDQKIQNWWWEKQKELKLDLF